MSQIHTPELLEALTEKIQAWENPFINRPDAWEMENNDGAHLFNTLRFFVPQAYALDAKVVESLHTVAIATEDMRRTFARDYTQDMWIELPADARGVQHGALVTHKKAEGWGADIVSRYPKAGQPMAYRGHVRAEARDDVRPTVRTLAETFFKAAKAITLHEKDFTYDGAQVRLDTTAQQDGILPSRHQVKRWWLRKANYDKKL